MTSVWHAFCTFIQHVQGRYNIVRKVYKVERLIDKMLERGASFLSFSGNMKNGGNMKKWIQPWTNISCGCSSKMQHERKGTNMRIIIWEMNI